MDIATQAVIGVLFALLLPKRPATRWCIPFFMLACAAPDIDILFCADAMNFVQLHRGISHSIFAAPIIAFLFALLAYPLWRRSTPDRLSLLTTWLYFLPCLYLHLLLDCMTSLGARVLLPFSNVRVHADALYLVDPFLTVPMLLLAVCGFFARKRQLLASIGLLYALLYPCLCFCLNQYNAAVLEEKLADEGRNVSEITILPDFLSPFYWRAVYRETYDDKCVALCEQSLGGLGRQRGKAAAYTVFPPELVLHLAANSERCCSFIDLLENPIALPMSESDLKAARISLSFLPKKDFAHSEKECVINFAPVQHDNHPSSNVKDYTCDGLKFLILTDLRFGSGLVLGRELLKIFTSSGNPYKMMLVLDKDDNVILERMAFGNPFRGTGWSKPKQPEPQTFAKWLMGTK